MNTESETTVVALVTETINTLTRSTDFDEILPVVQKVSALLPKQGRIKSTSDSVISDSDRVEFSTNIYARFAEFLLEHIGSNVDVEDDKVRELYNELLDGFFMHASSHDAFLVLCGFIEKTSGPSRKLDFAVSLLESFLKQHKLADILWEPCGGKVVEEMEATWNDELITVIITLPNRLANKLRMKNRDVFLPSPYFKLLGVDMWSVIERLTECARRQEDCCLNFLSKLLGRLCLSGNGDRVMKLLVRGFEAGCRTCFVCRRVSHTLFARVPERCMESVMTPLVTYLSWYGTTSWLLGDLVLTNGKLRYIFSSKFLLLKVFDQDAILRNVVGYLAADVRWREVFLKPEWMVASAHGGADTILEEAPTGRLQRQRHDRLLRLQCRTTKLQRTKSSSLR
ncbi:PREDICTED: telomere length regulation protein TEL2 homolog [Priapulus caudatus]|uniref:Telomere length regulation protein TEL2 homolog n=1 Tax=Priapulus caudatus TaxID=37621 RepID=A0ABM1DT56_PRICU|nr:PREDICTED: telomere length regulation protein TEL2 homolog [Priapulus caudatus]